MTTAKKPAAKKVSPPPAPAKIPELEPVEPARTRVAIDIEIFYERLASDNNQPLEDVADDLQLAVIAAVNTDLLGAIMGTFRAFVIRSAEGPA